VEVEKMLSIFFSVFLVVCFYQSAFGGETIYAKEIESYMYSDGRMKHSEGKFENSYFLDGDKITRTKVYDLTKDEIIPDNTIYIIQRQLSSDPKKNLPARKRVIRAIGQPGTDAVEILAIEINGNFIQSVKSTANYLIISRYKRVR
jgi:hypothetical protein